MKKFLFTLGLIFTLQNICFASTSSSSAAVLTQPIPVDFIYINGSNNNNEKMHQWFLKGIKKFHPVLKAQIEKNEYTYKYLLNNGEYEIEPEPSNYFWGYKSQADLMFMREKANLLRSISPWVAFFVRNTIANIMHDAIWVQKTHNMVPILQELDAQIKADLKQGKKVVLLGYSAGSFITMEYIYSKAPYINIENWFKDKDIDEDLKILMKENPRKNTCLMAFIGSNMTMADPLGHLKINNNKSEFISAYKEMDDFTDIYCVPENSVIGIINYASPIPLFYSDMADKNLDTAMFYRFMYKYLVEHDFFILTANYADDPLGFPNGVNRTNADVKSFANLEFDNEEGFIYDYSRESSGRTFAAAHTSYWNTKKRFAKAIVKGYTEGHKYQYDPDTITKRYKKLQKQQSKNNKNK